MSRSYSFENWRYRFPLVRILDYLTYCLHKPPADPFELIRVVQVAHLLQLKLGDGRRAHLEELLKEGYSRVVVP